MFVNRTAVDFELAFPAAGYLVDDDRHAHPNRLHVVAPHTETDHIVLLRGGHVRHIGAYPDGNLRHERVSRALRYGEV